jgi:hypothetical protein
MLYIIKIQFLFKIYDNTNICDKEDIHSDSASMIFKWYHSFLCNLVESK